MNIRLYRIHNKIRFEYYNNNKISNNSYGQQFKPLGKGIKLRRENIYRRLPGNRGLPARREAE
jgi:hypothetical protein